MLVRIAMLKIIGTPNCGFKESMRAFPTTKSTFAIEQALKRSLEPCVPMLSG